jgi:hypothetical protein
MHTYIHIVWSQIIINRRPSTDDIFLTPLVRLNYRKKYILLLNYLFICTLISNVFQCLKCQHLTPSPKLNKLKKKKKGVASHPSRAWGWLWPTQTSHPLIFIFFF